MPSFVPLGPRVRLVAALLAAAACVAASVAAVSACLTAPPSDIGTSTNERPSICGTPVPPQGLLSSWPSDRTFLVPVCLADPNAPCAWRVFDKDLETGLSTEKNESETCLTSVLDSGVVIQDVTIFQPTDGHCHFYTFVVAHGFSAGDVPDSIGGDIATWEYAPPGALCNFYDAGAYQDGAFPAVDAGFDGVPITPESGPLPESGGDL
jgi:hypothetical protein